MMEQIDLSQDGLRVFFLEWHIPILRMIDGDTFTELNPLRTRDAWINLNKLLPAGTTRSRASVIGFLKTLEKRGWLDSRQGTGKGGHRALYWKKFSLNSFVAVLKDEVNRKLRDLGSAKNG